MMKTSRTTKTWWLAEDKKHVGSSYIDALSGQRYEDPGCNYAHVVANNLARIDLPLEDA